MAFWMVRTRGDLVLLAHQVDLHSCPVPRPCVIAPSAKGAPAHLTLRLHRRRRPWPSHADSLWRGSTACCSKWEATLLATQRHGQELREVDHGMRRTASGSPGSPLGIDHRLYWQRGSSRPAFRLPAWPPSPGSGWTTPRRPRGCSPRRRSRQHSVLWGKSTTGSRGLQKFSRIVGPLGSSELHLRAGRSRRQPYRGPLSGLGAFARSAVQSRTTESSRGLAGDGASGPDPV